VALVQNEPRGTIRMTCPVTLAQTTIGPILPKFMREHPHVRIDMIVTNRVIDLVQEGVDVALRVRPSVDDSGSLIVKKLSPTNGLLVASPQMLAREGRPQSPEELQRLPTVAMSAADGRATWQLRGPHAREFTLQHKPCLTADDLLTLRYFVIDGTGMTVLPDYMCWRDIREGRLEEVLPGWAPPTSIIHAVFPSRRGLVPAVRRFLDFLGENVTGEGIGCPT
jgi:DNA-binding transcriptional LysR family regulator